MTEIIDSFVAFNTMHVTSLHIYRAVLSTWGRHTLSVARVILKKENKIELEHVHNMLDTHNQGMHTYFILHI